MADKNETFADIRKDAEAKFRELVEAYMQRRSAFQTTVGAMQAFNNVFDRLEAAWKREKAAIEADALEAGGIVEAAYRRELSKNASKNRADFGQLGDAAKLREAVMHIQDLAEIHIQDLAEALDPDDPNVIAILDTCRDALASPPRNCDTPYNDRVEMYGVFKDWCNARGHTMEPKLASDAFDWLLAPATEQEGGVK